MYQHFKYLCIQIHVRGEATILILFLSASWSNCKMNVLLESYLTLQSIYKQLFPVHNGPTKLKVTSSTTNFFLLQHIRYNSHEYSRMTSTNDGGLLYMFTLCVTGSATISTWYIQQLLRFYFLPVFVTFFFHFSIVAR